MNLLRTKMDGYMFLAELNTSLLAKAQEAEDLHNEETGKILRKLATETKATTNRLCTLYLIEKVDEALTRYGSDIVSVDLNYETGLIDVNQCHHAWSDVIFSSVIAAKQLDKRILIPALNKRHVGYCL